MKRQRSRFLAVIPIAVILMGWEILARAGIINPVLFPPPTKVLAGLAALSQKGLPTRSELFMHAGFTLMRVGLAFAWGTAAGVLVGLAMGTSRAVQRFFEPLITVLMPIPGIALAPLFILWFGFGDFTIISLGALSAFFPISFSATAGVHSIDKQLVRAAMIMGAGKWRRLFSVYLPWSAGYILNGVKISLARCWMTVVAVEFVAATNWGLGYMIWNAAEYLRSDLVYGGILLLIVIYFVLERGLINLLEKNTIAKWGVIRSE